MKEENLFQVLCDELLISIHEHGNNDEDKIKMIIQKKLLEVFNIGYNEALYNINEELKETVSAIEALEIK